MIHKKTFGDIAMDIFIYGFMIIMIFMILIPFMNALAISFNDATDTARGGVGLWPRIPTIASYRSIFTNPRVWNAYYITVARTIVGTVAALFCTGIIAFGLAHRKLIGRRLYSMLCIVPMYFSGGLIPYYFLIRGLNLFNTFWVYIIPNLIGLFNIILMRTFFQEIPDALEESAHIDGANYLKIFFQIIVPISTPIIATIALFVGVFHWNSWFDATIFVTRDELKPMQNILLRIINEAAFAERIAAVAGGMGAAASAMGNIARGKPTNVRSITMATMFVTILPIVMVYPFLQRFFIKGIMVGSIKG